MRVSPMYKLENCKLDIIGGAPNIATVFAADVFHVTASFPCLKSKL